jgi:hypothetical protein
MSIPTRRQWLATLAAPGPDLALLWVTVGALPVAVDARQARGLHYQE